MGIVHAKPYSFKWAWKKAGIDLEGSYTHEPLPYVKTGGRGPDGRKEYKHVGGGLKRPFFQVDFKRVGKADGSPREELVLDIRKTWWRNQFIALVVEGTHKRWIIATKGMAVNTILRSHSDIPTITVSPRFGDSHPLGALPIGTLVCCVERKVGEGARVAMSAGASAVLVRKPGDGTCVLRMPSKREMLVDQHCHAVVGQVSNEERIKERYHKFGQLRWLGVKQRSGYFQKKGGRFGRKIWPVKRRVDYTEEFERQRYAMMEFTKPGTPEHKVERSHIFDYSDNPRFRWHTDVKE